MKFGNAAAAIFLSFSFRAAADFHFSFSIFFLFHLFKVAENRGRESGMEFPGDFRRKSFNIRKSASGTWSIAEIHIRPRSTGRRFSPTFFPGGSGPRAGRASKTKAARAQAKSAG